MRLSRNSRVPPLALAASMACVVAGITVFTQPRAGTLDRATRAAARSAEARMSDMGRAATRVRREVESGLLARAGGTGIDPRAAAGATSTPDVVLARPIQDDEACQNDPACGRGYREGPRGGQAELSIAVDSTGRHVVVGFNDQRGFAFNPVSVSGFMYSDDGGQTFVDGGQLPSPGTDLIGTTAFPQIFGDPDVKYVGGCTFVYSSLAVIKLPTGGTAQTIGIHRSVDCGHTWSGPAIVEAATNPSGQLLPPTGSALDAADKEFIDVDPETGRIIVSWTNFRFDGAVEMLTAFSDDGGLTWPVATRRVVSATDADGQASVPRFAGNGSTQAYVAWRRFPFPGTLSGYGNTIAVARSADNGATWEAPAEVSPEFLTQDYILGNDRSNTSPSLAVDRSRGPRAGHVYLVYANNNAHDGADIVFQKSSDLGATFSRPILLNSRPGSDRAQWFPWVAVDETTGRVSVFYYDQGIAASGDHSEVSYTFSNDGGTTWSRPRPLTARPFHAGHGNDSGQPNLGDYNQAVSQGGVLYAAYALASRPALGFVDGQPDLSLTAIDATVRRVGVLEHLQPHASVSLGTPVVIDGGAAPNGHIDPRETATIALPLFNYVTNPLNAAPVTNPVGVLSSPTPGVVVQRAVGVYRTLAPGEARTSNVPFRIRTTNAFVAGTPIELRLDVISVAGHAALATTLYTGTPVFTTLLAEDFETASVGVLPAGWAAVHGGGLNTVDWTTVAGFCGRTSQAAFHQNADDNPTGADTRWERLFSPTVAVPADAEYVTVDFDVCYDTEEDPTLRVLAYDGMFLRVADLTSGRTLRSVLVEAFADEFTTGAFFHYPKHLPRSSNSAYFEDMSAWAGPSGGVQHVRLRLPGMQGSAVQLRFEYTQDFIGTCTDIRPGSTTCGVWVDNVVVRSAKSAPRRPGGITD